MDYNAIASIFLLPTADEIAPPSVPDSPARRLRDATEAIATIGWWSRSAADAVTALGHGFFDGYVWGRAASLGADVDPSVVVSAFGVFNATLLGPVFIQARSISDRTTILAAREAGATEGLRQATVGISPATIESCANMLLDALAPLEPGPRPLFGALQALRIPTDPYGRLWRAAELVREHRGDGHLAACVAVGLNMAEMNVLTEVWLGYRVGEYSSTRGFDASQLGNAVEALETRGWIASGQLTAAGKVARDAIESATDLAQHQLIRALSNNLDAICSQLDAITAAVLAAHATPADPRKRAAG